LGIAIISLRAGGVPCTVGKLSIRANKFALKLTLIEGLHIKLCTSKVAKFLILKISRLPLGSPKTK
jgi:hypothetical protein